MVIRWPLPVSAEKAMPDWGIQLIVHSTVPAPYRVDDRVSRPAAAPRAMDEAIVTWADSALMDSADRLF